MADLATHIDPITRDSDVRSLGDISLDRAKQILSDATSPMLAEVETIWQATKGHSAFALAISANESTYGKAANAGATHNPLGIMDASGSKLASFPTWTDAFKAWMPRMTDPSFKGGVYPKAMQLDDFCYVYVGGKGCLDSGGALCANGETKTSVERYIASTVDRLNRYYHPVATGGTTFGLVPYPAIESRLIPLDLNTAWDDLGQRHIKGICLHRMLGTLLGTDVYFRNEARAKARTDFGIGKGRIFQWTQLNSRVAPWANGPANDVEGDGVAYVRAYGIDAVNRDTVSIEWEGLTYDAPIDPRDKVNVVSLVAWLVDSVARVPASRWPKNNDGIHMLLGHYEFGPKECPGSTVLNFVPELIDSVGRTLAKYQSGG